MPLSTPERVCYLMQSAAAWAGKVDRTCPSCQSPRVTLVRRKFVVTSLWSCDICGLRFRLPRDNDDEAEDFYQDKYSEGFTTSCPSDGDLAHLMATGFRGSNKDFRSYIEVLRAIGLAGASVLDFGSSWGYGSWQMSRAGFKVYSYEISRPRAAYAREKLQCNVTGDVDALPERVQCMFSAHVIEHLPNPNLIWEVAQRVLTPDGTIVCFCPNGDPGMEAVLSQAGYDLWWGKVHPLMITPKFLQHESRQHGFQPVVYSSPYLPQEVSAGRLPEAFTGHEICLIARRERP